MAVTGIVHMCAKCCLGKVEIANMHPSSVNGYRNNSKGVSLAVLEQDIKSESATDQDKTWPTFVEAPKEWHIIKGYGYMT